MNTWYYIKNWFTKPKQSEEVLIPRIKTRKKRDNATLTDNQIHQIQKLYTLRNEYGVKTYAEFTKFCNEKLDLNKSRSVYHRIISKQGSYEK